MTARAHLEAVFGDQAGWVFIGIGTGQHLTDTGKVAHEHWAEKSFRWPAQADEIINEITRQVEAGADVYFTPSLSENPVREKPKNAKHGRKALPVHCLWVDLDDNWSGLKTADFKGRFMVFSGGGDGRRHMYLPLVNPAAPDVAEDLLRRLAAYLGGDPAVTWHGAYLRPVGTKNWKRTTLTGEPPTTLDFASQPSAPVLTVDDLDKLLPAVEHASASGDIPDSEPVDGDLPGWLEEIISEPVTTGMDRSRRTMAAVGACRRAYLTDGQIITVMRRHRPTVEKYDGSADAEVARVLAKIPPELDQRRDRGAKVAAAIAGDDRAVMAVCIECPDPVPLADLDDHNREVHGRELHAALPDGQRATDVGNAARLLKIADGKLRHVHAWGKWLVYRDSQWVIDEGDVLVTEQAKGVARQLFRMTAGISGDKDLREIAWKWSLRSETSGAIAAMIRLARGAPGILVEHEQLDANPHLLNVRNGTIDLRTGILRAHDPADLITVQCPVHYDPDAAAPLWRACVERWQPDPTVRAYVQVRAGAGATGKPTETVDVDYGSGGNGKSKFWGAIQHVLGDYTVVPHKSLLVAQRHEQHATVVARLFRKRLAVASETRAADVLDDEQVKNLTGGDRLSGRRMREDPWEFQPTHTLVMFSNHKPTIQGRDEGIWRRLRLVPWEVTIPEDERDTDLADKLALEAPGILVWIVDGARRFLAEGLTPPEAVRVATDAYRAAEDTIGRFIADVLTIGDGWVMSSEIKAELEAWCEEQGVDPIRMNEVAETLRGLGCRDGGRKVMNGKRSTIWHGVRVAEIKAETL